MGLCGVHVRGCRDGVRHERTRFHYSSCRSADRTTAFADRALGFSAGATLTNSAAREVRCINSPEKYWQRRGSFCHCFKYRRAIHPDFLKMCDSTSLNCNFSCRLTPSNNRLPSPARIVATTKLYSSTRPSSISCDGISTPPTKIFLPCSCFSLSISSRRFVRTILVFSSSALANDREKTIFFLETKV